MTVDELFQSIVRGKPPVIYIGDTLRGGLPSKFWQLIDNDEFKQFCQTRELTAKLQSSIRQYAVASQKESLERLEQFREKFDDIIVVEVR